MYFNEEWEDQIDFINEYQHYLTMSEEDFIYGEFGIKKKIEQQKEISFKQSKWLRDIYNRIQEVIG